MIQMGKAKIQKYGLNVITVVLIDRPLPIRKQVSLFFLVEAIILF